MANSNVKTLSTKKPVKQKPARNLRKKMPEKNAVTKLIPLGYLQNARQFLRESKLELKKVKWPTKKEILASTGVVIFLTIIMACYFFLVDTCLVKVIRSIIH